MKNTVIILILVGLFTVGCYEEFRNDYPYTTVAFSTATGGLTTQGQLGRTVVIGEGLELDFGVYLAGLLENDQEWWVDYMIDPSLLDGTPYDLMPEDYYTLSNESRITIPKGEYVGKVTVTLDSTSFVNDPRASGYNLALPIRLTDTNADSLHTTQSTKILVIKYINYYDGYYDQTGTYETVTDASELVNSGSIDNVIKMSTVMLDTVLANGMIYIGSDYEVKYAVNPDNTVYIEKTPVGALEIINLAMTATLSTDYVSPWESLEAIRDGYEPSSSTDKGPGAYGNWWSGGQWRWVQYEWPDLYYISQSDVYWWTDGGGIQIPTESYIEYWNTETEQWELVPNHSGFGVNPDMYNITTFDEVLTNKIRIHMRHDVESCGILEWKVWGYMAAVNPEQARISSVTPTGECIWDPETSTYHLEYRIDYEGMDYHTNVNTRLVWRNRIRDGVNEWRR
ncbi:MAG: DUF1735 domain-containing protein [Bacteroidales bacterium]